MEQKYGFLLSPPLLSFNEMGNVEATGNLDVTFLNAVMLSLRFGFCKQVANIRSSCIAGLQCCSYIKLIRNMWYIRLIYILKQIMKSAFLAGYISGKGIGKSLHYYKGSWVWVCWEKTWNNGRWHCDLGYLSPASWEQSLQDDCSWCSCDCSVNVGVS